MLKISDFMEETNPVVKIVNEILEESFPLLRREVKDSISSAGFVDIFPHSDEERESLIDSINLVAKMIHPTDRGDIYVLDEPVKTKYGEFWLVKIRIVDPTRTERGAPDFLPKDYSAFKSKYSGKEGFKVIEREDFEMMELMSPGAKVRIYFPNKTVAETLGIHYGVKRGL